MKLAKSLLLASAAGFAAFGAQAADLPSKKAAPVEYVKVCNTYGAGFFVVPGTDGCLRVGGRVRFDIASGSSGTTNNQVLTRAENSNVFRTRAYIYVDHRQQSEVGLVRTYARLSFTRDANSTTADTLFELGFVQVGGLTAGRFTNPYDNIYYTHGFSGLGLHGMGAVDRTSNNGIAYTAALGNGLTATLGAFNQEGSVGNTTSQKYTESSAMPDVVGAVEWTQGWGSAKLAGTVHQVRYTNPNVSTDYGYGVSGNVKINLPMIAAGDFLALGAQYSSGAAVLGGAANGNTRGGEIAPVIVDATVVGTSGKLATTYGFNGGLDHYWTKTIDTLVYAGYVNYDNGATSANKVNGYNVAQYTRWMPVAGLQLGVETGYRSISGSAVKALKTTTLNDTNDFYGRLRVQRDF